MFAPLTGLTQKNQGMVPTPLPSTPPPLGALAPRRRVKVDQGCWLCDGVKEGNPDVLSCNVYLA